MAESIIKQALQADAERADKYAKESAERLEQKRVERANTLKAMLQKRLGIDAEPTDNAIEIEGYTFAYRKLSHSPYYELYITESCDECDGWRSSYNLSSLADLGRAVNGLENGTFDGWQNHEHDFDYEADEPSEKLKAWRKKHPPKEQEEAKFKSFCPFTFQADGSHQSCDKENCGAWLNGCASGNC